MSLGNTRTKILDFTSEDATVLHFDLYNLFPKVVEWHPSVDDCGKIEKSCVRMIYNIKEGRVLGQDEFHQTTINWINSHTYERSAIFYKLTKKGSFAKLLSKGSCTVKTSDKAVLETKLKQDLSLEEQNNCKAALKFLSRINTGDDTYHVEWRELEGLDGDPQLVGYYDVEEAGECLAMWDAN